jgi:DNA-directed RNA polymerase subunit H (RpoH/RPB5)
MYRRKEEEIHTIIATGIAKTIIPHIAHNDPIICPPADFGT